MAIAHEVECDACYLNERDRPSWLEGPWKNEPNRVEWEHAGLPCIAHRGCGGAWCGYVGLSPSHPLHGKSYMDSDELVEVHGGLTFGRKCGGHICHVPKSGEPDDVFWLGFDCAHAGDYIPKNSDELDELFNQESHYWTLEEVQAETNRLAEQLAAIDLKTCSQSA